MASGLYSELFTLVISLINRFVSSPASWPLGPPASPLLSFMVLSSPWQPWPVLPRALKSSQHSLCSLLVVDTPGFQNPRLAAQQRGATFEELCHNYTQERLQTLFHERTFVREMERYKEVPEAPPTFLAPPRPKPLRSGGACPCRVLADPPVSARTGFTGCGVLPGAPEHPVQLQPNQTRLG